LLKVDPPSVAIGVFDITVTAEAGSDQTNISHAKTHRKLTREA
jgi:hypothetical protein